MTKILGITPVVKTTRIVPEPHCVRCTNACTPVFPGTVQEDGKWDSMQVNNGLVVELSGGYGMYVDTEHRNPVFVLCGECVDIIRKSPDNKWFNNALGELEGTPGDY